MKQTIVCYNMQSKSGHTGDMLIGYRGFCEKCGAEKRVYFAYSRQDIRRKMLKGLRGRLAYKGNCEVCFAFNLFGSVRRWELMPRLQVDKDLAVLGTGQLVDFANAAEQAADNQKSDKWLDDNEKHVEDYIAYRKKHDPMS